VTVPFLIMGIQESFLISSASGYAENNSEICLMLSRDCEVKLKVVLMEDSSSFWEVQLSEVCRTDTAFKCGVTVRKSILLIGSLLLLQSHFEQTFSFCVSTGSDR
jgi:hypothetical protein